MSPAQRYPSLRPHGTQRLGSDLASDMRASTGPVEAPPRPRALPLRRVNTKRYHDRSLWKWLRRVCNASDTQLVDDPRMDQKVRDYARRSPFVYRYVRWRLGAWRGLG